MMTYEEIFNTKELVGYFASAIIVLSFLAFNDLRKIRLGNLVGALIFVVYGILINRIPIVVLNAFIVFIQIYFLWIKKNN
jgi:hypothetical protein